MSNMCVTKTMALSDRYLALVMSTHSISRVQFINSNPSWLQELFVEDYVLLLISFIQDVCHGAFDTGQLQALLRVLLKVNELF